MFPLRSRAAFARPSVVRALGPLAAACALLLAASAPAWAAKITFRYQPVIGGVASVTVAGTFNNWDPKATPMTDPDEDGIFETVLDLDKGRYEYKFVVNGDQWMTDETAADFASDGLGGQNSVLEVGDKDLTVGVGSTVPAKEAPAKGAGLHKVTFRHKPQGKPSDIFVAGQFNDWNVGRTPMSDPDGDGEYTATILLPAGEYQYKFVVGGTWTQDKAHEDRSTDDGFGGQNSIVVVDDRFPAVVVKRGDGEVNEEGVSHEQTTGEVNNLGGGRVELMTRAHGGDVDGVDLWLRTGNKEDLVPMSVVNSDVAFDYYAAAVAVPDGRAEYQFRYRDGGKEVYLTARGFAPAAGDPFVFDATRFPAFVTPDWVKDGVIYQIFPDRFRNGDPANDQDFSEWYYEGKTTLPPGGRTNGEYYHLVKDWYDIAGLTKSPYRTDGRPDYFSFYGGDVAGVRQGLDYLQDLGITAIYFNPIFEAKSNHKYDCADYGKIDPHMGTNEEFIAFVKEARERGIHVILDIVYNHCGNSHWAFKEAVEKGPNSDHYDWFEFKRWPLPAGWPNIQGEWKADDYYYCWWGFGDLPDLNFDLSRNNDQEKAIRDISQAQPNIALVKHLLDTTEYWIKEVGVDGVRLDVPNEVPGWFWTLFRKRVKDANPDAYVVGELWGNAKADVGPHMFDAVMNYAYFRDPVARFLGGGMGTAAEFDATLAAGRATYPTQAVQVQMNLIDSHDTVRFLTQVGRNENRLRLAVMFGMTYVGAPHIYYGDEIGMEGGKDPDCRRPFLWNYEQDPERVALRDYYKKLIAARKAHAALRTGEFRSVITDGKLYGYTRGGGGEEFLVLLNAGRQEAAASLDLAAWGGAVTATDLLSGAVETWSGTAAVAVPAETGRLFRIERSAP